MKERETLSTWSIRNPIATIVFFSMILVLGLIAFPGLGVDETPNIDLQAVTVLVTQHGANPHELETQVTRPVEDALSSLENIEDLSSAVGEGVSRTDLSFAIGTNIERALSDARNAVERIRDKLPQNVQIQVERVQFIGGPFATYTVSSTNRTVEELSWLVDNTIAKELLTVHGVGIVERSGGIDPEVKVKLDSTRLSSVGINASSVNAAILAFHANLPSGRSDMLGREHSIRTLGGATSLAQLGATRISIANGASVPLSSLGRIELGTADPRQAALLNGKPVVAFSINKSPGCNLVDVAEQVERKLAALKTRMHSDIKIQRIRSTAEFVRESYNASLESFLVGAVLSVVVIWFFLRNLPATLVSSLAIPLSVIPTFAVMHALGYSLNNMSLLGLALVIGILVDDAIVEIENVVRHLSRGKSALEAAIDASNEIALAVIATSLTLIVVFAPVGCMSGMAGQFFKQFGITIAIAVFFSMLVARMLTPMLAAKFMKTAHAPEDGGGLLAKWNNALLSWALNNRLKTIAGAIAISLASVALLLVMPKGLVNISDKSEIQLVVEQSPGTTMLQSRSAIQKLTDKLRKHPEVAHVFAKIGSSEYNRATDSTSSSPSQAVVYICLKPKNERRLSQGELEAQIQREIAVVPGIRTCFNHALTYGNTPMLLTLTNSDHAELNRRAETLLGQMSEASGLCNVSSNESLMKPGLVIRPDAERAAANGISSDAIASEALTASLGDNDERLARFVLRDRPINIRVEVNKAQLRDLRSIENLRIRSNSGTMIPLSSVASITFQSSPAVINRYWREREVTLQSDIDASMTLGAAFEKVRQLPALKDISPEFKVTPRGDIKLQKDIFDGFAWAILVACLLEYAVLAILFGNFLHPLTIMVPLPLSLCGALLGLIACNQPVGLYALIGILMLMGLVTKNSILLVDYAISLMKTGMDARRAIVEANNVRMRPILMTTVAMVAGMLPIAVGIGAGSEARAPMAIAVVGGLITASLFTLVVVPVLFTIVQEFQDRVVHLAAHRLNVGRVSSAENL